MSFLTILFALLGWTVDFQPYKSTVPQGGTQTETSGPVIEDGGQSGTQAEHGGMIAVGG